MSTDKKLDPVIKAETDKAIERLIAAGLLDRWWCTACEDYVPYRVLEMSEATSRSLHTSTRHKEAANA